MKKFAVLILLIGATAFYFFVLKSGDSSIQKAQTESRPAPEPQKDHKSHALAPKAPKENTKDVPSNTAPPLKKEKPDTEQKSLENLAEIIAIYAGSQNGYQTLIDQLKAWELKPTVARDENPHTGSMTIIRTKNTLPGTRYFHAQYFSDENNEDHLQHMSFEFRPGPDAFSKAIDSVSRQLKIKNEPSMKKDDFISWNQDNGYVVWIKKMNQEDMKDDPFNAYTKDDVGTIRVAIELEIHDH